MTGLDSRQAAILLLRAVMRWSIDGRDADLAKRVLDELRPADMFQVEHMMVLEAAQSIHARGERVTPDAMTEEMLPEDPAGLGYLVMQQLIQAREKSPIDAETAEALIQCLISLRSEP